MSRPCVLIVDGDILVRHPLAEYLRACGYRVLEAASTAEARLLFEDGRAPAIDVVLADVGTPEDGGFALAAWIRARGPGTQVVLAGSPDAAADKARDICDEGPALAKPYDHRLVLDRIKRLLAARDRS